MASPSNNKLSLLLRVPGTVMLYLLDKLSFIPPVRAARLRISSFYNAFCAIYQFATTVDIEELNRELALLPLLTARLTETEQKLAELTERFASLVAELEECGSDCTAVHSGDDHADPDAVSPKSADTDDDGFHSSKSRKSSGANGGQPNGNTSNGQSNGHTGNGHANGGDANQPPPPPPPPTVEDFRFTSTPSHPVFLSRGKLHDKAAKGSGSKSLSKKNDSFGSDEGDNDVYVKQECKKQRVLPEDLLHQRTLLRKFVKVTPKKGSDAANASIEEDDGSLNTLMTNALKRKFATVNDQTANSLNDSSLISEETTADFTL